MACLRCYSGDVEAAAVTWHFEIQSLCKSGWEEERERERGGQQSRAALGRKHGGARATVGQRVGEGYGIIVPAQRQRALAALALQQLARVIGRRRARRAAKQSGTGVGDGGDAGELWAGRAARGTGEMFER
jgi:hypothetical protein